MTNVDRIRTEHFVEALVAGDTVDLLVTRIRRLLSHGRRLSMTRRYTYVNDPPELFAGLVLDETARDGGLHQWNDSTSSGMHVALTPGRQAFGFAVYPHDENETEEKAWSRYHAAKAESADWFERRHHMTLVELTGGRDSDGPSRNDRIVLREWNGDGVCDERVIAFEAVSG